MTRHTRVAVIGGGVVGTSVLYHLAKAGWDDCVLLERTELTAGSTWHAAGLLPLYHPDYTMSHINMRSINLYGRLEAETGEPVSFHRCGQLRLATSADRMDEYHAYLGLARPLGIECAMLSGAEAQALWPICDMGDVIGALYHPGDGHIAPADLTHVLARAARAAGAEIRRQCAVEGIEQTRTGEWRLQTSTGDVIAQHVVSATGNYARQTGAMVGLDVPSIPVLHQYLVSDPVSAVAIDRARGAPEFPVLRDDKTRFYLRQEGDGLLLGPYDPKPASWAVDGVPADFGADLLPPEFDRVEAHVEGAIARCPSLGTVGIRSVVHGPIAHTPDGNPLLGPAPGLRNFWLAEGFTSGIMTAGGSGELLAEWITEGTASVDMWSVDPRRYGRHIGKIHTMVKNEETYGHIFDIHYPNLEMPAARPAKTSPCHDRLTRKGAIWGEVAGWERANWFAPRGFAAETLTFRRSEAFEHIAAECRAVRLRVGLLDMTSFSSFEVSGPAARGWLDRLLANRLPEPGRLTLAHILNDHGKVVSEFTVACTGPEAFTLIGPALCERQDEDILNHAGADVAGLTLANTTLSRGCFVLAGPRARELMSRLCDVDLGDAALPWFAHCLADVGWAANVRIMRVNYMGELGYELHHDLTQQHHLLDAIEAAGSDLGLRHVGFRALDSLRLEKSYRAIKSELTTEDSLDAAGMGRFVRPDKGPFVGREAVLREREHLPARMLATIAVDCAETDVEPGPNQALLIGDQVVGRTLSGAFGHWVGYGLALAWLPPGMAQYGTEMQIAILDRLYPAKVIPDSPHDPGNDRPRGGSHS